MVMYDSLIMAILAGLLKLLYGQEKVKNMKNQITFVVEENDDINKLRSMNKDLRNAFETILGVR